MPSSESQQRKTIDWTSCYARFDGSSLTVGNECIERSWLVREGLLYPTSLLHKQTGIEWMAVPSTLAITPDFPLAGEPRTTSFAHITSPLYATSDEALQLTLTSTGAIQRITYHITLFPKSSAVLMQVDGDVLDAMDQASGQRLDNSDEQGIPDGTEVKLEATEFSGVGCQDLLELAHPHLKLRQVEFWDQTDRYNELMFEKEWLLHPNEAKHRLQGNVFVLEDPLTESGFVYIKHGPLPHVRPVKIDADLLVDGSGATFLRRKEDPPYGPGHPQYPLRWRFYFQGHGTGSRGGDGYSYAMIAYSGGRPGLTAALQDYQRTIRGYAPERDAQFLSNTWGDRSRDARIQEDFILSEIEAGAKLGVDIVQIDAGWQKGTTINSVKAGGVWEGFWAHETGYWDVDLDRFPRGLEPVIAAAEAKGMRLGLWFAPDSSQDFSNWEKDAEKILELYRLGIHYIKIDAVKARTKQGEANLHRFFNRVLDASRGEVVFDIDVTAEVRPGYWGLMHPGPLFVENRYTDSHRYWPHQTLRNLWKLSHYIDPARLRMEWLNQARNTLQYGEDPLAPAEFSPAYLFATVMISNPLGWFEVTHLPEAYFAEAAPLIQVWKQHRAELFSGHLHPIGEAPDGIAWTGFLSLARDRSAGYVLLFREDHPESHWLERLRVLGEGDYDVELLYGEGQVKLDNDRLSAEIPAKKQFVFAKLRKTT